jgi:hypothetical protein
VPMAPSISPTCAESRTADTGPVGGTRFDVVSMVNFLQEMKRHDPGADQTRPDEGRRCREHRGNHRAGRENMT